MVQLADKALTQGYYSEAAADLAEFRFERHPSSDDVVPLFLELLRQKGVELPSTTDATWALLTQCIRQIVHGEVPVLDGLKSVAEVCHSGGFPADRSRYLGQPFGVTALYTAYSTMEDLDARPKHVAFRGKYGSGGMVELTSHVKGLPNCGGRYMVHRRF